jgi:hypothetical protein
MLLFIYTQGAALQQPIVTEYSGQNCHRDTISSPLSLSFFYDWVYWTLRCCPLSGTNQGRNKNLRGRNNVRQKMWNIIIIIITRHLTLRWSEKRSCAAGATYKSKNT